MQNKCVIIEGSCKSLAFSISTLSGVVVCYILYRIVYIIYYSDRCFNAMVM